MHHSTYEYLKPTEEQLASMARMPEAYAQLQLVLEAEIPASRYRSLATTALEESAMWANKGVTRDSDGTPRDGAAVDKHQPQIVTVHVHVQSGVDVNEIAAAIQNAVRRGNESTSASQISAATI